MSYRGHKSILGILLATGLLVGLAGCQDSARNPVQVHPPQITPPAMRESLTQVTLPLEARR